MDLNAMLSGFSAQIAKAVATQLAADASFVAAVGASVGKALTDDSDASSELLDDLAGLMVECVTEKVAESIDLGALAGELDVSSIELDYDHIAGAENFPKSRKGKHVQVGARPVLPMASRSTRNPLDRWLIAGHASAGGRVH